jgi:uncharacterized protein YndB with AHSA1/START domain
VTRVAASVELSHPVDRVFRVATRIPDLPKWLPEVVEAQLLDPVLATGSRIRLRMGEGAGGLVILGTAKAYRQPELLEITGKGGPVGFDVRVSLAANGADATRISLEVTVSTPPFLGFIGREAERRIGEALPASLARFRALLDAEPA